MDLSNSISTANKEKLYIFALAVIQFAHIVDFVVLMPLGPILMEYFAIGPNEFASLVSSYSFSAGIFGVLYGVIADRFGRKNMLIFSFIGFILATALCGLAHSFFVLLLGRLMAGCFGGVLNGVVFAIVTDLIPYERRGQAMGVIMSAFSVASVLGVPLGLAIAAHINWQSTFWFIALVSLPILFLSVQVFPPLKGHIQKNSFTDELKRFFKLLKNINYFKAYSFIFIISFSSFMLIPFLSPYGVKNVGIAVDELKYIYLVGGIFTIISSRVIGLITDKVGAIKLFIILALISMIPIYLYTNAPPMGLIPYLALSSLFMMLVSGRFIPAMTLVSAIAKEQDRGTFMGLLNSIRAWASASATIFGGLIIKELPSGKLGSFEVVGLYSIGVTLAAIFFCQIIKKILIHKRNITP